MDQITARIGIFFFWENLWAKRCLESLRNLTPHLLTPSKSWYLMVTVHHKILKTGKLFYGTPGSLSRSCFRKRGCQLKKWMNTSWSYPANLRLKFLNLWAPVEITPLCQLPNVKSVSRRISAVQDKVFTFVWYEFYSKLAENFSGDVYFNSNANIIGDAVYYPR